MVLNVRITIPLTGDWKLWLAVRLVRKFCRIFGFDFSFMVEAPAANRVGDA